MLTSRNELDITDEASIAAAIERHKPWAVINTAGFVRTWEADERFDECLAINAIGPELLGRACKRTGIPLVTFSSDLVFDGKLGRPYAEPDIPAPSSAQCAKRARILAHTEPFRESPAITSATRISSRSKKRCAR